MDTIVFFILGIALLVKGADLLVDGSSALARKIGVPSLVIGLTVVAFGTSLPELFVNITASLKGAGGIAFGNVLGSNMANVLLVLGVAALLKPLPVKRSTVWLEIPFALLAVLVLIVLTQIGGRTTLARRDGLILLAFFGAFLYYTVQMARRNRALPAGEIPGAAVRGNLKIGLMITAGLAALYFGGEWTVEGPLPWPRSWD